MASAGFLWARRLHISFPPAQILTGTYFSTAHYIRTRGYIRGYTPTSRIFDADIIRKNIRGYIPEDISFFLGIYPPRGYIRGYIPLRGYIPPKKGYIRG